MAVHDLSMYIYMQVQVANNKTVASVVVKFQHCYYIVDEQARVEGP